MTEESVSATDQAGAPAGDSGSPAADFAEPPGDSDVADSLAAESADTLPSEPAQEATLVYAPKIIAVFVTLLVFLPLMGAMMSGFMRTIGERIAGM